MLNREIDPADYRIRKLFTQAEMDAALATERKRCAKIAEIVNDSIKEVGKFAGAGRSTH